jgi:hypothetical protein
MDKLSQQVTTAPDQFRQFSGSKQSELGLTKHRSLTCTDSRRRGSAEVRPYPMHRLYNPVRVRLFDITRRS